MSIIQVQNLSFTYPGDYVPVFTDLTFSMSTDWRLGLVGRNGRGKTTLMRLLAGQLKGSGKMISHVGFDMFPFEIGEAERMDIDHRELHRPLNTFSPGEKTRLLLAAVPSEESLSVDRRADQSSGYGRAGGGRAVSSGQAWVYCVYLGRTARLH